MFGIVKKNVYCIIKWNSYASDHTKYVLWSRQKFEIQPTLINLNPDEYSQAFHCYPFSFKLDRCFRSCNTLIDIPNKVCTPNKREDLNLSVFNIITGINKSKTSTEHLLCECKCGFDGKKM